MGRIHLSGPPFPHPRQCGQEKPLVPTLPAHRRAHAGLLGCEPLRSHVGTTGSCWLGPAIRSAGACLPEGSQPASQGQGSGASAQHRECCPGEPQEAHQQSFQPGCPLYGSKAGLRSNRFTTSPLTATETRQLLVPPSGQICPGPCHFSAAPVTRILQLVPQRSSRTERFFRAACCPGDPLCHLFDLHRSGKRKLIVAVIQMKREGPRR